MDGSPVLDLSVIIVVENLQGPGPKVRNQGNAIKLLLDLLLKFVQWDHFPLGTVDGRFLSGAVVIGVFLDFAGLLDEFPFGFSGIKAATLATADKAGESKGVLLGSGFAFLTHQDLDSVKLLQSNHGFMFSLELPVLAHNNAGVEDVVKDFVDATSRQWVSAQPF